MLPLRTFTQVNHEHEGHKRSIAFLLTTGQLLREEKQPYTANLNEGVQLKKGTDVMNKGTKKPTGHIFLFLSGMLHLCANSCRAFQVIYRSTLFLRAFSHPVMQ